MRFLAGSSRLAADERVACVRPDGRRSGGSPRAIALQVNHSSFYWLALGLIAAFIIAAIAAASAAHDAEKIPAREDLPTDFAQASERAGPPVTEEGEWEVSNASTV